MRSTEFVLELEPAGTLGDDAIKLILWPHRRDLAKNQGDVIVLQHETPDFSFKFIPVLGTLLVEMLDFGPELAVKETGLAN